MTKKRQKADEELKGNRDRQKRELDMERERKEELEEQLNERTWEKKNKWEKESLVAGVRKKVEKEMVEKVKDREAKVRKLEDDWKAQKEQDEKKWLDHLAKLRSEMEEQDQKRETK